MSTKSDKIGVAKEILSYCGRCKLALAHVIMDMKTEKKIGKCQCKTCKAIHNYRDPVAMAKKARAKRAAAMPDATPEELWKAAIASSKGTAKPYAMNKSFQTGELIDHSTFGRGVVMERIREDKIEVQFEAARKLLISAPIQL